MRQVSNSLRPEESMMPCTVRVPSTLRKTRSSSRLRRILLEALAALCLALAGARRLARPPTSIVLGSTAVRNTMSIDGIFFSMMGHSSTIRIPSMRMKSALMGAKFSRS